MESLVSVRRPHTDHIFDFTKTVEWRKRPLRRGKNYAYESVSGGGCGRVIGEFTVTDIRRYNRITDITSNDIKNGCVDIAFLREYAGSGVLYAHTITNVKRYDIPLDLSEFGITRPPQSWCRVRRKDG